MSASKLIESIAEAPKSDAFKAAKKIFAVSHTAKNAHDRLLAAGFKHVKGIRSYMTLDGTTGDKDYHVYSKGGEKVTMVYSSEFGILDIYDGDRSKEGVKYS